MNAPFIQNALIYNNIYDQIKIYLENLILPIYWGGSFTMHIHNETTISGFYR